MDQRSISRLRSQIGKRKDKIAQMESALFEKEALAASRKEATLGKEELVVEDEGPTL